MMNGYFKNRHTVREYTEDVIPDKELYKLIEAATHAPSTGNMQLYSIIITKDKETLKQLHETHFNQPASVNSKTLITFCADFNRFEKWCKCNNATPGYRNFQSFMSAVLDTVIVAQQFVTISEMSGYGCCYLGTTTYNADRIAEILDLPDMVIPIVTLSVGVPMKEEFKLTDRLPLEAIIHCDKYSDYDEIGIHDFYHYKDEMEENKYFIRENNKETLAQVFTDVRYTKENNEAFSKIYLDLIEKKGFKFPKK